MEAYFEVMFIPPVVNDGYDEPLYFFTSTILNWNKLLLDDAHKQILIDCMRFMVVKNRIVLYAFVIMPNHIHMVFCMRNNYPLSGFRRDFHKYTAQQIIFNLKDNEPQRLTDFMSTQSDRKNHIWERKSFAIAMYYDVVVWQKIRYIHNNPLQKHWKLASRPEEYRHSSASLYDNGVSEWEFLTLFG